MAQESNLAKGHDTASISDDKTLSEQKFDSESGLSGKNGGSASGKAVEQERHRDSKTSSQPTQNHRTGEQSNSRSRAQPHTNEPYQYGESIQTLRAVMAIPSAAQLEEDRRKKTWSERWKSWTRRNWAERKNEDYNFRVWQESSNNLNAFGVRVTDGHGTHRGKGKKKK